VGRRLPAAVLIGVGLAALYEALHLPFGSVQQPDSGFFPTVVALALIVFSASAAVDAAPASQGTPVANANGQARVWTVIVTLVAYAWAIAPVGFVLCTVALLVVLLRGIGRVSWRVSLAAAAIGSIVCYALFTRLGLPLPAGVLGF
jgi:hypothetical protein